MRFAIQFGFLTLSALGLPQTFNLTLPGGYTIPIPTISSLPFPFGNSNQSDASPPSLLNDTSVLVPKLLECPSPLFNATLTNLNLSYASTQFIINIEQNLCSFITNINQTIAQANITQLETDIANQPGVLAAVGKYLDLFVGEIGALRDAWGDGGFNITIYNFTGSAV